MLVSEASEKLARFFEARGIADDTPPDQVIAVFFDFYAEVEATGLGEGLDGDMLLFQYGVYEFGESAFFELDITRQFVVDGPDDEDAISQLHCTTLYEASLELRAIPAWNLWCQDQTALPAFREAVWASAGYQAGLAAKPLRREIWLEEV